MTLQVIGIFLVLPGLLLWLAARQAWAARIGVILLCYLLGLLIGGFELIPASVEASQQQLMNLSVALAIPMLLFSLDLSQWRGVVGRALFSMLLAMLAAVTVASSLFFAFRAEQPERAADFAALTAGVYTGGTPNLAAVKEALSISHSNFIVFHGLDTVASAVYLLALLAAIPLIRRLLGSTSTADQLVREVRTDKAAAGIKAVSHYQSEQTAVNLQDEQEDYRPLLKVANLPEIAAPLLLSALLAGLSLWLSEQIAMYFAFADGSALFIVLLTSLSLLLGLSKRVRALQYAYRVGMYCIFVFCLTVAAMVDPADLLNIDMAALSFVGLAILGVVTLHMLFCKLAGVDADTFMVTSVAAIASPPFVPMMARALKNPQAILAGMSAGILGYALGSYLGIALGLLLRPLVAAY